MSKRYTLAVLAGLAALFAAPAVADGYANKTVNHGPPPLKAHAVTPPEPGCYPVGHDTWSCPPISGETVHHAPVRPVSHHAYGATTRTYIDESQTRHYTNRYTTGGECCGGTPPPPRARPPVTRVHADRGIKIDIAGFGGGVGAGVDGGYYGGGGGFAYASASSSASAYSSAAARIAFSGGFKGRGGHKGGGKKGGGSCGCH